MDITLHGDSCFRIKGKKTVIVTNPDKDAKNLKGDLIISSLKKAEMGAVEGAKRVFNLPGEYEAMNVPIVGIRSWTKTQPKEQEEPAGDPSIIFYFSVDNVKFCHLGAVGHILTSDMINKIGDVDILMIDTSTTSNLTAKQALEIIEAIDPKAIISMGQEGESEMLQELGGEKVDAEDKYSLKNVSELPNDKRLTISLRRS